MMDALPRFSIASSPSPEISSVKRVQRAHWMQRSRSRTTYSEIGTAFGKCRFSSMKRVTPGPYWNVMFCNGHSPPRSQIGQSSG